MIAQVFELGAPPEGAAAPGPPPGAAQDAMKETRSADGCEGLYLLVGRDRDDGFAIVLWRDEAAMNAMRKREEEHLVEIRKENPDFPEVTPKLYDVISA
jgi:heme-degrading monooxygenase HmoA